MRIGIDITPLIQEKPTGVHLITEFLTKALIRNHPSDTFVLTALLPRALKENFERKEFFSFSNVEKKLIPLPSKVFHVVGPWWQELGMPPIEFFTGHIDVFHSYDWFTFHSNCLQTVMVFDLTTKRFPDWHTNENTNTQNKRLDWAARRADHVFCLSQATLNDWMHYYPQSKGTATVIYPDTGLHFNTIPDAEMLRKIQAQLPVKKDFFLYVGTLEPRKNVERLVAAYIKLRQAGKITRPLLLIGSWGWKAERLKKMVQKDINVMVHGYVENALLPAVFHLAYGLTYPSYYEGFGIPVLEALKVGTPVMTSTVSSLPEAGGPASIYVNPYDEDSIAQGLLKLDQLKGQKRDEVIKKGFEHAKIFSYQNSAAAMRKTFDTL